ncbi:hypothetical protein [Furfurilactobacillus milii]|uniref:Uncharacterized protein n=1 Tax=Furfurilactobacillus milii TaxID=2888272 RepID=A0ABT6D7C7_9LACO|nr:hypothetical protein [Furfurilactobacillus milii]QLE66257.1 hypothetical protein LROSL2_0907 [Furfurilactobacillus rossiae]MCF6159715.1 hypothetical protein [Furfurilactobacillus milii]MCF6163200.1 hypothetical protein [Furfurilactobacillus milii]MCF6419095.1 hypothetical protein [Furfurilactobacillus milii]MDF9912677.1 hypothetical protein [Furfurilactobacillus milii]
MNDDQNKDHLTREQYRQQSAQQTNYDSQPDSEGEDEPTRSRLHRQRRSSTSEPEANPSFDGEPNQPSDEPTSRMQATGPLTPEQKQKRLAHRLNIAIIVLVILIVLVYLILRFVG